MVDWSIIHALPWGRRPRRLWNVVDWLEWTQNIHCAAATVSMPSHNCFDWCENVVNCSMVDGMLSSFWLIGLGRECVRTIELLGAGRNGSNRRPRIIWVLTHFRRVGGCWPSLVDIDKERWWWPKQSGSVFDSIDSRKQSSFHFHWGYDDYGDGGWFGTFFYSFFLWPK